MITAGRIDLIWWDTFSWLWVKIVLGISERGPSSARIARWPTTLDNRRASAVADQLRSL